MRGEALEEGLDASRTLSSDNYMCRSATIGGAGGGIAYSLTV